MKIIPKLKKDNVEKYFDAWAIQTGDIIVEKAEQEKWDYFDYASTINFMLWDIRDDVKKLINELSK